MISTMVGAEEIRVGAGVADKNIYVGQPFQYQVIIEGHRQSAKVNISPLKSWSPKKAGERDFSSERISIFNGKRTRVVEKKYVMAYMLTADSFGWATLPPVKVTIDNKTYMTNEVRVNIQQPEKTDSLQLEVEVSPTKCVVGQPITLTLHWYLNKEVGEYYLNVPALKIPDLFTVEEIRPVQKSGTKIVEVKVGSKKTIASMYAATYQNRNYTAITFQKILIPQKPGRYILEAPTVSCDLEVNQTSRRRDSFDLFFRDRREYQRFQATGKPITLQVQELPKQDPSESFSGLVGQYEIKTQASPTQVNVGDPITLTISITGDLPKVVDMPDLQSLNEFAANFKIPKEQSPPKIENNTKQFTQTLRVDNDQVKEIPPITLKYFDVDQDRYVTVQSDPIPLEVAPTHIVTADQAIGESVAIQKTEIEVVQQGIAANYEGPDIYQNQSFNVLATLRQPVFLTLYLGPLLLLLIALTRRLLNAQSPVRKREKRRAYAFKNAVAELKKLEAKKSTTPKETALKMGEILRTFIADGHDKKSESLTSHDCRVLLTSKNNPSGTTDRFCELLEKSDNSRYGGDIDQFQSPDYHEITHLLKTIRHD